MCNAHRLDDNESAPAREALRRKYQIDPPKRRPRARVLMPREPIRETLAMMRVYRDVVKAIKSAVNRDIIPEINAVMAEAGTRQDSLASKMSALEITLKSDIWGTLASVGTVISTIAERTAERATEERIKMIRAAVGIEPTFFNDDTRNVVDSWKEQNDAFIRGFAADTVRDAMDIVGRGARAGTPTRDIAAAIRKKLAVSASRARTIARTEIAQLNAAVVRERDQQMGITEYTWRTSKDERVRESHKERDGKRFKWSDPPPDGHPGQPINCRCTAEPVLDFLVEGLFAETPAQTEEKKRQEENFFVAPQVSIPETPNRSTEQQTNQEAKQMTDYEKFQLIMKSGSKEKALAMVDELELTGEYRDAAIESIDMKNWEAGLFANLKGESMFKDSWAPVRPVTIPGTEIKIGMLAKDYELGVIVAKDGKQLPVDFPAGITDNATWKIEVNKLAKTLTA